MFRLRYFIWFSISLVIINGCVTPPVYDIVPEIGFNNISSNFLNTGSDTLVIEFSFQDGDGNIGAKDNEATINAWLVDTRTGFPYTYQIPFVPPKGTSNAISGKVWVTVSPLTINCRPDHPTFDTLSYKIYIRDRAENQSNTIETPPIVLKCN